MQQDYGINFLFSFLQDHLVSSSMTHRYENRSKASGLEHKKDIMMRHVTQQSQEFRSANTIISKIRLLMLQKVN